MTSNTISFYLRILRDVYNRAAETEAIENRITYRRRKAGQLLTIE